MRVWHTAWAFLGAACAAWCFKQGDAVDFIVGTLNLFGMTLNAYCALRGRA